MRSASCLVKKLKEKVMGKRQEVMGKGLTNVFVMVIREKRKRQKK